MQLNALFKLAFASAPDLKSLTLSLIHIYKKIKEDPTIKFTVAPSFRPDKAININKPGFAEYMGKLAEMCIRDRPMPGSLSASPSPCLSWWWA